MKKITKQQLLNEKMNMPVQKGLPSFNDVYQDLQRHFEPKDKGKSVESDMDEGKLFTKFVLKK